MFVSVCLCLFVRSGLRLQLSENTSDPPRYGGLSPLITLSASADALRRRCVGGSFPGACGLVGPLAGGGLMVAHRTRPHFCPE